MNNKTYNLKNAKQNWMEVTTRKITKIDAKELYNELIQKEIDALERQESQDIKKFNISNTLKNVGSIFTDLYFHYKDVPKETRFERNIAQKIKLRTESFDEIKRKEQIINNELFKAYFTDYQSPSSMHKN